MKKSFFMAALGVVGTWAEERVNDRNYWLWFVQPTPTMVLRHDRSKKVFSHTPTHTTRHGFRHGLMEGGARHGTGGLEAWIPIWFKYSIFCACRDPCFLVFGGRAGSLMRGGIAGNARSLRPQQLRLRRRNDIIMAPLRNVTVTRNDIIMAPLRNVTVTAAASLRMFRAVVS